MNMHIFMNIFGNRSIDEKILNFTWDGKCQNDTTTLHADFAVVTGVYGDQVNEMSWAVGEVLDVIRELQMDKNTLALFFSDHGPHLEICEEGGSAALFRGGFMQHTCRFNITAI